MKNKLYAENMIDKLKGSLPLLNLQQNPYKGKLIVFDGLQRSGKTTIINKLILKLERNGYEVILSEWNSHPFIKPIINDKKMKSEYTPLTWFVLHYADFVLRYEEIILPKLREGKIVICDRYIYTALSRDVLKGIDPDFILNAYGFILAPDITIFLTVDKEVAYQRYKEKSKDFIQQYNTGLDVCPINNDLKSTYIKYNQLLEECYILMSKEFNIPIYDMSIHQLDEIINKINI